MKKISGYTITLHMCNKNYNMICDSSDMVRDGWRDEQAEKVIYEYPT